MDPAVAAERMEHSETAERCSGGGAGCTTSPASSPTSPTRASTAPAPKLVDFRLRHAVERGGDEPAKRIADAEAPFWRHVRDAVALISADD
jgi:hypothetical protein